MDQRTEYQRSYMLLRLVIGALGVCLPWLLILGDRVLDGEWRIRDSVSAYYYSGTRDGFVATMFVIGVFLVTYRFFERKRIENWLSIIAGFGAVVVGWFPTSRRGDATLTPLQDWAGESRTRAIHYVAAFVFVGALIAMSAVFGRQEATRTPRPGAKRSRRFWRNFHFVCAGVMVAGAAAVPLWAWLGSDVSLWLGEAVAVEAFGVSWLAKGAEWDLLFGKRSPEDAQASALT